MLRSACVAVVVALPLSNARAQAQDAGNSGAPQRAVMQTDWLAEHQSDDGAWRHQDGSELDVGLTGLALLALLGEGHTHRVGPLAPQVAHGAAWLVRQQDAELGRIGKLEGHSAHYQHAIATLALSELYLLSDDATFAPAAQAALDYIASARNPYGAWRYDYPPTGDNDSSVTGWMLLALISGRDAGLDVDEEAIGAALTWFSSVTDPETARVGYDSPGSQSSRTQMNEHFPTESGEAMTAVALLGAVLTGSNPHEDPLLQKQADLLLRKLPEWDPEGLQNDLYYWYFGSMAMYQVGGEHWVAWERALKRVLVEATRGEGESGGHFTPTTAWGQHGGHVYTTSLMRLIGQVHFRYARLLGQR